MGLLDRIRQWSRKLRNKEDEFISVVLLLRKPRTASQQDLEEALARAWQVKLPDTQERHFVLAQGPLTLVKVPGGMVQVLSAARPYIQAPTEFAKRIGDARIRDAVLNHGGWISVDHMLTDPQKQKSDSAHKYSLCAKLAAELVSENCLGVCFPGENRIVAASGDLAGNLRTFRNVDEFCDLASPPPVVDLSDEFIEKARLEATKRFPEFVKAFEDRLPNEKFFLKRKFSEGEHAEWMWVDVTEVREGRYLGSLENDPLWIKSVRRGDKVEVAPNEVEDWLFAQKGKPVGGFSFPKET
jgi:uncharacterized protein YegJ (DUF2314 family)